jgi:osmotically-inducible protein OsmY
MKTDMNIRIDVENELRWDPSVDEKGILVRVAAGVVTLQGFVPHFADRWTAEEVAKRVAGVRAIANDIEVKIPKPGERSDTDIATAAVNALKWHFALESSDVKVVVNQGWLTLSGHVPYGYQKTLAESAVRYLLGVRGVFNDIEVRSAVKATDVKQKIQSAFQRQASLDAKDKDIKIDVDDTAVVLQGTVHSWKEKDDASLAAWAAPGVTRVENKLQVHL